MSKVATRRALINDWSAVADAYQDGATANDLAAILGVSNVSVRRHLEALGVTLRRSGPHPPEATSLETHRLIYREMADQARRRAAASGMPFNARIRTRILRMMMFGGASVPEVSDETGISIQRLYVAARRYPEWGEAFYAAIPHRPVLSGGGIRICPCLGCRPR